MDYKEAIALGDKPGAMVQISLIDPNQWAPWVFKTHKFRTIGVKMFRLPPALPKGYKFDCHEEWAELYDRIQEGWQTAEFGDLDMMELDQYELIELVGDHWGDSTICNERSDYLDWFCSFDGAWGERAVELGALFETACTHRPPYSTVPDIRAWLEAKGWGEEDPLPNREMPPSLVQCLEIMLKKAKEQNGNIS